MSDILRWIDRRTYLMILLFLFWSLFWGLNGLDKFFNGKSAANLDGWAAKAVLVGTDGKPLMKMHPIEPRGFFGVTRDNKMIGYFRRIGLGPPVALVSLYVIAVAEVVLGLMFVALFVWSYLPYRLRARDKGLWGVFHDRTFHRLSFKGGIAVFVVFAVGDILFGDRAELWEHGTYMVLCLVTYDLWFRTDRYIAESERREAEGAAVDETGRGRKRFVPAEGA